MIKIIYSILLSSVFWIDYPKIQCTIIVHSNFTKLGDFTHHVSIHTNEEILNQTTIICSGSIIDSHHVLTAAHCLYKKDEADYVVMAGTRNLKQHFDPFRVRVNIEKILSHHLFHHLRFENDIAILRVTPPFPTDNPFVQPIELGVVSRHGPCEAIGWGKTKMFVNLLSENKDILHKLVMHHYNKDDCEHMYMEDYKGFVSPGMICMESRPKKYCPSDSGGPLICEGKLAGLFSFTRFLHPEVFTQISYFKKWIDKKLERSHRIINERMMTARTVINTLTPMKEFPHLNTTPHMQFTMSYL